MNARSSGAGRFGETICALIERSIGAPENFGVIDDRSEFMHAALRAGVRVPCTEAVDNDEALKEFAAKSGYPLVLKANGQVLKSGAPYIATMSPKGVTRFCSGL